MTSPTSCPPSPGTRSKHIQNISDVLVALTATDVTATSVVVVVVDFTTLLIPAALFTLSVELKSLNPPNNADTRPRFQTRHLHREPAWPSPPTQPPRQRVARWEKDELSLRPVEVLTFPLAVDIKTEL